MNFYLILLLSSIVTLSLLQISQQVIMAQVSTKPSLPTNHLLTYENPTYGIKVQYPINWEKVEANLNNENFTLLAYFHPAGKEDPSVNVYITFLSPQGLTPTEYDHKEISQLTKPTTLLNGQPIYADETNHIDESNMTTLAGNPVHRVVWTEKYTDSNGVLNIDKKMEVWSIVGDQVYGINFIPNDVSQYTHYLPIAQKIISSFKITKG
jgi:eukaryotic-like serine/threonine-protein kinase